MTFNNRTGVDLKQRKSQKYFNRFNLVIYDLIFGFVTRFCWLCPIPFLDRFYANHVSNNHLEVGPGTGYLLNRVNFKQSSPQVVLMDLSLDCLEKSANRLQRHNPQTYRQNVLEPITQPLPKFDSIAINYVLHCVPGSFVQKGVAFAHLKKQLSDDGVLFGCTILYNKVNKNPLAKAALWFLQTLGIFVNQQDNLKELRHSLEASFTQVEIEVRGPTAVFVARN